MFLCKDIVGIIATFLSKYELHDEIDIDELDLGFLALNPKATEILAQKGISVKNPKNLFFNPKEHNWLETYSRYRQENLYGRENVLSELSLWIVSAHPDIFYENISREVIARFFIDFPQK